mmetsp:Transcript_102275/g.288954  ORF Transcript_102275/g.288954 Transcript_102275/m.288954 type:complete len:364 (+) Transcript_102275:101-1192(+)
MGFRSWVGAILSLGTFLVARRFTAGLAAPTFVAVVLATVYAWTFVLRVPKLRRPIPKGATTETEQQRQQENVCADDGGSHTRASTVPSKEQSLTKTPADAAGLANAPPTGEQQRTEAEHARPVTKAVAADAANAVPSTEGASTVASRPTSDHMEEPPSAQAGPAVDVSATQTSALDLGVGPDAVPSAASTAAAPYTTPASPPRAIPVQGGQPAREEPAADGRPVATDGGDGADSDAASSADDERRRNEEEEEEEEENKSSYNAREKAPVRTGRQWKAVSDERKAEEPEGEVASESDAATGGGKASGRGRTRGGGATGRERGTGIASTEPQQEQAGHAEDDGCEERPERPAPGTRRMGKKGVRS